MGGRKVPSMGMCGCEMKVPTCAQSVQDIKPVLTTRHSADSAWKSPFQYFGALCEGFAIFTPSKQDAWEKVYFSTER